MIQIKNKKFNQIKIQINKKILFKINNKLFFKKIKLKIFLRK